MYALAQFMSTLSGKTPSSPVAAGASARRSLSRWPRAGCDVAVNYISREADARATSDAIRALGRRTLVAKGDVSKSGVFVECLI